MWEPTLLLAAAEAAENGNVVSDLAGQFGIEWQVVVAQMVNFIIVAFLLWKFAFKPVLKTMQEREKKIADGLEYASEMKQKLAETEKRQEEILRKAQQDAGDIISTARTDAKELYDRQTNEAQKKVEDMLKRGREANELERQKMISEVRNEIARLVVMTSEKVLSKELSDQEKSRLNSAAASEIAGSN